MTFDLFYDPKSRLCLTTEDRTYLRIKMSWAAPLSRPNRYLSLMDEKGKEIVMIADPSLLPTPARDIVEQEIRRRYLSGVIDKVLSATTEFGATYWLVETSRGQREFVTQSLQENAQWLGEGHLLLIDVDGNRFEIQNINGMDKQSQTLIWNSV